MLTLDKTMILSRTSTHSHSQRYTSWLKLQSHGSVPYLLFTLRVKSTAVSTEACVTQTLSPCNPRCNRPKISGSCCGFMFPKYVKNMSFQFVLEKGAE